MPFIADYKCEKCNHIWEELTGSSREFPKVCLACESTDVHRIPGGVCGWSNDAEVRSEMLKKRSFDHTKRTAKDNVERIMKTGR